jgi:branched-chain amino acid transport system permease protein
MHLFLSQIESGLALAAVYGLIAVTITFTYRVTGIVPIAQGSIMTCGVFAAYFVAKHTPSFLLSLAVSAIICAFVGLSSYELIFRWLLSAGHLAGLVAGLALLTGMEEALRIAFFGGQPMVFPELDLTKSLGTTGKEIMVIATAVVVGLILEFTLRRTATGRRLRAVADNVEMARVLGVRAERTRMLAFVAGAAVVGVAGVLFTTIYGSIAYDMGTSVEFIAIACVLLGGLGSIPGALMGSVVVGLGQTLIATYVSSAYVTAFVFGIVLLTIAVKPGGLLGLRGLERS